MTKRHSSFFSPGSSDPVTQDLDALKNLSLKREVLLNLLERKETENLTLENPNQTRYRRTGP